MVRTKLIKSFITFIMVLALASAYNLSHAEVCDLPTMLQELKHSFGERFKNVKKNTKANEHAKRIKNAGLGNYSYMVDWKLKRDNQRGPWAIKGNTLIHGVASNQMKTWMEKVGKKSFGLGFKSHPWDVTESESAVLRIRDRFYSYSAIQRALSRDGLSPTFSPLNRSIADTPKESYTEATFMATSEELNAMVKFLEDRVEDRITAIKIIRSNGRTREVGTPLRPIFDSKSTNLMQESCAGACSSMFHPDWLFHYNSPTAIKLATMAVEKGMRNHSSANAMVFSNFRNPNTSAITIFNVNTTFDTPEKFINEASWGKVGGMMWGFIPDRAVDKPSPNYTTKRIPLKTWIADHP